MKGKPKDSTRRTPVWGYCTKAEADAVMREAIRRGITVSRLVREAALREVRTIQA